MEYINDKWLQKDQIDQLNKNFESAHPYKHIVVDDFLKPAFADKLEQNFPSKEQLDIHYKGLNENKSEGNNFEKFDGNFEALKKELMGDEFCKWVDQVTGINNNFVTDDKMGIGLHKGGNESFLDVHIDFNIHPIQDVHRRLNMLIYLNKDWKDEYGGHFEMWDSQVKKCEKRVAPAFNRMVMFETSEISYHGYSKITCPENVFRKSFYVYYYTNVREDAAPYHDTMFKSRPDESTGKRFKTTFKENAKNFIKSNLKKMGFKVYKI